MTQAEVRPTAADVTITLVRHGQSQVQVGQVLNHEVPDHVVELTPKGWEQARELGRRLDKQLLASAQVYVSPYLRTRQTLRGIYKGAGLELPTRVYDDPRLREVESGYVDRAEQQEQRERFGWFWYRYEGGESAADCYDRVSGFLESLMRQLHRHPTDNVLIVTHGAAMRCFVLRFLHQSVDHYDTWANPDNCSTVTIRRRRPTDASPMISNGRWTAEGIRLRTSDEPTP